MRACVALFLLVIPVICLAFLGWMPWTVKETFDVVTDANETQSPTKTPVQDVGIMPPPQTQMCQSTVPVQTKPVHVKLPKRFQFQAAQSSNPNNNARPVPISGNIVVWRDEQRSIPLKYAFPEYENPSDLVSIPERNPTDLLNQENEKLCSGFWTGTKCVYDGDECDCNASDRKGIWRKTSEGYQCELQGKCKNGIWNGTACVQEGGVCFGEDPQRLYHWRNRNGKTTCSPIAECSRSWFSVQQDKCVSPGEKCEIAGGEGIVTEGREDGVYRCSLQTQKAKGFSLQGQGVTVANQDLCYDECAKRADGCAAFSYSEEQNICKTIGKEAVSVAADDQSVLHFSKRANIYPDVSIKKAGDKMEVEWNSFNCPSFEMARSRTPDMKNQEKVEASGTAYPFEQDDTWYFESKYEMGNGIPPIPIQKRFVASETSNKASFKSSDIVFRAEALDNSPLEIRVSWSVPLGKDIVTEIQYHGQKRRSVALHGSVIMMFEEVGLKVFTIYVRRGRETLFQKTITVEAECPASRVVSKGRCEHFTGHLSAQSGGDMTVSLDWEFKFGKGVTAHISVGDELKFENIEATGTRDVELTKPGDTIISLSIMDEKKSIIHESKQTVSLTCPQGTEEFNGKKCVPKCETWENGKTAVRNVDGECLNECGPDHVPVSTALPGENIFSGKKKCVLRKGIDCAPGYTVKHGKWSSDGKGGCSVQCDSDKFFKMGDECYQLCPETAPPRAMWVHDDNNECTLACMSPALVPYPHGCFQDCPKPIGAGLVYSHDQHGMCKKIGDDDPCRLKADVQDDVHILS